MADGIYHQFFLQEVDKKDVHAQHCGKEDNRKLFQEDDQHKPEKQSKKEDGNKSDFPIDPRKKNYCAY